MKNRGFTLIELMISVAIIGILAAIAIPAYNDYMIRSRVSELVNMSSYAKTGVAEYRLAKNTMPTTLALAGVNTIVSPYVRSLGIGAGGVITVTGNVTNLKTGAALGITLVPTFSNGGITWTCVATGATQYAPSSCR